MNIIYPNFKPAGLLCAALFLLSACTESTPVDQAESLWSTHNWTPGQIELLEQGRKLYLQKCAACHQASGEGQATLGAPPLKGSAVVTGPVEQHIDAVLKGGGNGTMPAYQKILPDNAIAAIISYERNAWGNHDPELVTADQVKVRRAP